MRTRKKFREVVSPARVEYTCLDRANAAPDQIRWIPDVVSTGVRLLRECNACGLQWWETLEQKTLTEEERWPQ